MSAGDLEFLIGKLEGEFEFVARMLAPGGTMTGAVYQPRNPIRDDRHPGSFCIHVKGPRRGLWQEYSPALPGKGGAYDFVAYILGSGNVAAGRKHAFKWLADRYGLQTASPAERAKWRERRKVEAAKASREADEARARNRGRAKRLFLNECRPAPGTPTQAYLEQSRAIDFKTLGRWPNAIRHCDELPHPRDGVLTPAMVAAVTRYEPDGNSKFMAVHRTYIDRDAGGIWRKRSDIEPDVGESKFALGHYAGGAINVWRGASGKPLAAAPADDVVVITEGLEDALTIAFSFAKECRPAPRILCALSISNIANVSLPEAIRDVRIAVDNDAGNRQTAAAIEKATAAFTDQGRIVGHVRAGGGAKDFNEQLQKGSQPDEECPF